MGKIYFASDFHLGAPDQKSSRVREERILRWLDFIQKDAEALYLVGDIFDFWFEYKYVVPKGYVRFLGKLGAMKAAGIKIYIFTGNHDMWMFSYLQDELDIPVFKSPISIELKGKSFFIGHGDGLGPGDRGFKRLRKVFHNSFFQWFFARFHPNFSFMIANFWSNASRNGKPAPFFRGIEEEYLIIYCEKKVKEAPHDFFVFGHRHLPIDHTLNNKVSRYINLGEWITKNSYGVFDGETMEIQFFENDAGQLANR
ncbi:MAG: UDP-2,3-diacylglucosamine diphosphatase [Saprospiraceae bacterium]